MARRRVHIPLAAARILLLSLCACTESLPPPQQPPVVLSGSLQMLLFGPSIPIRNGAPTGTAGGFEIRVTNIYDEVLQDSATVEATIDISLKDRPDIRTVVNADVGNLTTWEMLAGDILTIEPGSTAILLKQWTHRTQDGIPFWEYVPTFTAFTTGGVPYCQSDSVRYLVRGSVRLFKYAPSVLFPPQEISVTYQVFDLPCKETPD